ncbi:MAG: M15 family metallopeptidase [Actinomycetota bacterium]
MRILTPLVVTVALMVVACGSDGAGSGTAVAITAAPTGESTDEATAAAGASATTEAEAGATTAAPTDATGGETEGGADPTDGADTTEAPGDDGAPARPPLAPGTERPDWLGTRILPTDPEGRVPPQATPPELELRRFPTVEILPAPPDDEFRATIEAIPADVLARSTWNDGCPVTVDELRYLTIRFWGFDGRHHNGEMIVHRDVADDVVSVFRALHAARFPIEEMRVTAPSELDAPPTGDGNNTTSFVCRAVVGGSRFSEHASSLAVDINPFQNPYRKGEVVLPELATSYLDRTDARPGMIFEGGVVVAAFDAIGWGWGGRWQSLDDYHHFSRDNR